MTHEQYLQLKNELKQLAQIIHYRKLNFRASVSQSMGGTKQFFDEPNFVKEYGEKHGYNLLLAIHEYRHKHIVMSLMRGKTREQIEKPKKGNEPNEAYIKKLLEQYAAVDAPVCISA
jgi:hypothetical protein